MLTRDTYPAGVPCWIDTAQPDPDAALSFYGGVFGWDFEERMPPGSPGRYAIARLGGRVVAGVGGPPTTPPAAADAPARWSTYVRVASADEAADAVVAAGGTVLTPAVDVGDAGRMAVIADPSGAELSLWQAGQRQGAEAVNEPGTWNWSDLHTHDVDGAAAFYGAVFGWEAMPVPEMGGAVMWRLPGYGDHLATLDPELRQRHAEGGVPAGFSDAVGWLIPAPDGGDPPRWAVTFAVDDTDATAARAAELGGMAVVAPFNAGPARMATLRDPQGAVFTISHYQPDG
jgi:uncharacterized protein